jgi:hypothetical protein
MKPFMRAVALYAAVAGATVVCHQTVVGAGNDGRLFNGTKDNMAAFRGNALVAARPANVAYATPNNSPVFAPGDWIETGSTGVPGELWWGRTADRIAYAGQESYLRLTKPEGLTPAQIPLRADSEKEHLLARVSGADTAARCSGGTAALIGTAEKTCIVPNSLTVDVGGHVKEYFDAAGAFFGDHARGVAITYFVTVNSPSRNRLGDTGFGVLILKAD